MVNDKPTELQKDLIKKATYYRGKIPTAYAQAEFLLADLSVKLDLRFPYLIKDRIKAAKRLHQRNGYEKYKEELEQVCDDLLQYDEIRNFMAHGFIMLTTDKVNNHRFEMRMYQRDTKHAFNLVTIETTIDRLNAASEHITVYVERSVRLFGQIYREQKLESF